MAKRPTTLRFRLMLLVVTAILPIVGLMLYQAACEQERKLRECEEDASRMATLAAGSISQATEGARQMLIALACMDPVRTMSPQAANAILADLLKHSDGYLNLGLVRSDGLVIACGLPMNGEVYIDDRLWFQTLRDTGSLSVSEYLVGRISGKPAVNLGYPLHVGPEGNFSGAVYVSLDLKMLQRCITRVYLPKDAVILVVGKKGVCLACHPRLEKEGTVSLAREAFEKAGGPVRSQVFTIDSDGIGRDYHYAAVPGTNDLMVAVGISRAAATAESRAEFRRNVAILVFWTVAALGGAWVVGRVSLLKHVNHLICTARRLAAGDWNVSASMSGGVSEIQQLASTFDAMAAALRQQNEELEAQVRQRTAELSAANTSLIDALAQVKTLNGLLPICSGCKKIRDDQGYWSQIELYIAAHSDARFSHSLCPDCAKKYYPELDWGEEEGDLFSQKPE